MGPYLRKLSLVVVAGLFLALPPAYLLTAERGNATDEPVRVITSYLKALYSREFGAAYRFISSADQRLKKERVYVRERGPFDGFALEVARKLSESIQVRPVQQHVEDDNARIKMALRLPDANRLSSLLLNWDEERLNSLPPAEQKRILATLDQLRRDHKMTMVEGEEEFVLVREGKRWKIFLDWASGVRVNFHAAVPHTGVVEAQAIIKETIARPSELFTIAYRVKNLTQKDFFARITHHVEPKTLAQHLDIVECALLLPVRILPGEEQEYSTTYLVRGDLPEGTKGLTVTYDFTVER